MDKVLLHYKRIPTNRYNEVIKHLQKFFNADEPLNKSVSLCQRCEPHSDLDRLNMNILNDGWSIMAVNEKDEIAGVVLNGMTSKANEGNGEDILGSIKDAKLFKIFTLLSDANEKVNFFTQFGVDKFFEIKIVSVDSKFRGHGIAKELLLQSEEMARSCGVKLIKTEATGLFSQKAFASLGFITAIDVKYNDYRKDGWIVFEVEKPHEGLKIMYKLLDAKSNL